MFELFASLKSKFINLWHAADDEKYKELPQKYEELPRYTQLGMFKKWLNSRPNKILVDIALKFWFRLDRINPLLPPPQAAFSDDEKILQFTWDRNEHHLDIDIVNDPEKGGTIDWFYRNRTTGKTDSGEQSLDMMLDRRLTGHKNLVGYIQLFQDARDIL
jgi:hypothetical protein